MLEADDDTICRAGKLFISGWDYFDGSGDVRAPMAAGLLTREIYLRNGRIVREDQDAGQLRERYHAAMSAS